MVRYQDGSEEILNTDDSWNYSHGPIIDSELYDGEIYDARLANPNWTTFGFQANQTKKAQIQTEEVPLVATANELIKKHEVFEVKEKIETPSGDLVLDFGQNLVGWVSFQHAGKAGDSLHIYHAEILDKEGEFYTENLRDADQKNTFILNGDPNFVYEPHFTFQGFRYIKIEGDTTIDPSKFKAIALYSAMPDTGGFETSNALINQLQHNIEWGQKGNFLDVPTDCPQRDERLGWTGDAQAFYNTAAFNRNVKSFFDKWLLDLALDQREDGSVPFVVPNVLGKDAMGSAGWADAATIIPWNAYLIYGDKTALKQHYPSMKNWVGYMEQLATNGLYKGGFHFGDWLFYRPNDDNSGRAAVTSKELIAQSFFIHSLDIMARSARVLGEEKDVAHYTKQLQAAKKAYQNEFITPSGRLLSETQTAYVLALQFGLLPENVKAQAVERLVDNIKSYDTHLTTGFLGTPYLCHVLSENGRADVAMALLMQKSYPSWLYPVTQGATTIWERWDGLKPDGSTQTPSMNSYNHYAYGAIGEWMYNNLLGIQRQTDNPGFKAFTLKPLFSNDFSFIKGHFETVHGTIKVNWTQENERVQLAFEVPVNTTAKVDLTSIESTERILFQNNKRKGTPIEAVTTLGSGKYRIELTKMN
jgi:alpha-L-rhamnosidase